MLRRKVKLDGWAECKFTVTDNGSVFVETGNEYDLVVNSDGTDYMYAHWMQSIYVYAHRLRNESIGGKVAVVP